MIVRPCFGIKTRLLKYYMTFWPANVICNWAVQYNNRMKKKRNAAVVESVLNLRRIPCRRICHVVAFSITYDMLILYSANNGTSTLYRASAIYLFYLHSDFVFMIYVITQQIEHATVSRELLILQWAHAKTCLWQGVRPCAFLLDFFLLQCNCYCVPEKLTE